MRKAKIILLAVGIIAIVGGALAFKAQYKEQDVTYYICNDARTHCDKPVTPMLSQGLTIVDPGPPRTKVTNALTAANSTDNCTIGCPASKVIYYRFSEDD